MEAVKIIVFLLIPTAICPAVGAAQEPSDVREIRFKQLTDISAPSYDIVIGKDGTVQYDGKNQVKQEGRRTSRISKQDFQRLIEKIQQIRFFTLKDKYDDYPLDQPEKANGNEATAGGTIVTDLPSQIVTVVTSREGASSNRPLEVRRVYRRCDRTD